MPPLADGRPKKRFVRGKTYPKAISWFGFRSFWGHLWHLAASVIATEDIDSRDWMRPDSCRDFTKRVADQLGAARDDDSITEALEGDLWIDFIADTGDDADVGEAVAALMFRDYVGPDPVDPSKEIALPRGQILLFGGDTAYPVATDLEIHNRVIVPFNRILRQRRDGKRRVLLGIPGNHDWYAGLDGYGRMFRQREGTIDRTSRLDDDKTDRSGQIGHFVQWVEAFRVGSKVEKRPALPLDGYTPLQTASYFALRLAPGLELWAVDRQLRTVDLRQRTYFDSLRRENPDHQRVVVMPDPAFAFLEPNPVGQLILERLEIDLETDGNLILTGDTHHYVREQRGAAMHVTAGGGGAFLHPAAIARSDRPAPEAEFPGPKASRSLTLKVPRSLALGRAGWMVHVAFALLYLPLFLAGHPFESISLSAALGTGLVVAVACFLIGGWREERAKRIASLSLLTGAIAAIGPYFWARVLTVAVQGMHLPLPHWVVAAAWWVFVVFGGAFLFGAFLAALTMFGLEQHQAISALAHPGYKHFVRLRVRKDGSAVDGWAIGIENPLDKDDAPRLVDRFSYRPNGGPASSPAGNVIDDRPAPR